MGIETTKRRERLCQSSAKIFIGNNGKAMQENIIYNLKADDGRGITEVT